MNDHRDRPTAPPTPVTSRAYEELDGAQGREVFFRPVRYRPSDLGPIRSVVEVVFAETSFHCDIQDVSQNGVAFVWPPGATAPPAPGAALPLMVIRFDQHEAYRGAGTVMSLREINGADVVGASFADALMDIEDVLHLRDVRSWEAEGAPQLTRRRKPWYVEGHEALKATIGEFRLFLEDASQQLAKVEASLPWNVVHGESDAPARGALVETLRKGFVEDVIRFAGDADREVRKASREEAEALKHFSQQMLDPYLLQAPVAHRAKTKPFGYPGDFEVMRFSYERHFEGSSLFAKALHLAMLNLPGPRCVPSRKDAVKKVLAARVRAMRPNETLRIASIAAGPAQEVYELLAELDAIPGALEIVLYDQDATALSFAFARLTRLVDARWARQVRIRFLHDSIKRLLQDPELFRDHAPFDAVICAGLVDYLDVRKSTVLAGSLYRSLRAGGTLYVGNFVPEQPSRWLLEHHLDWYLLYKTRDELLGVGHTGAPDASVALLEESVGYCPFVTVTRP